MSPCRTDYTLIKLKVCKVVKSVKEIPLWTLWTFNFRLNRWFVVSEGIKIIRLHFLNAQVNLLFLAFFDLV